jgi:hypothetical protein
MAAPESLWSRFIVCRNSNSHNRKVEIARTVVRDLRIWLSRRWLDVGEILAADGLKEQSTLTFYRLVRKTT